jgi:hypothetical protein
LQENHSRYKGKSTYIFQQTNIETDTWMDEITCNFLCIGASTPSLWGHQNQACV